LLYIYSKLLQWVASFDGPSAFLATLLILHFCCVLVQVFLLLWKISSLSLIFPSGLYVTSAGVCQSMMQSQLRPRWCHLGWITATRYCTVPQHPTPAPAIRHLMTDIRRVKRCIIITIIIPNFIKIGQTIAEIWRFNGFFKMAAVCHLGFLGRLLGPPTTTT